MAAPPHISRWALRMAVARRTAAARMAAGEADTTAEVIGDRNRLLK